MTPRNSSGVFLCPDRPLGVVRLCCRRVSQTKRGFAKRRRCQAVVSLAITAEPFDSPDAKRLIAALDAALSELYPPEQRFGPNLKAQHLAGGLGTFLVARDGGRAVGCGAIRLIDPRTAEVKRMYVEPEHRGKGVARAVLARLDAAARRLGARRLVLETGTHSPEALALYRGAGFTQIDCWGEYATSPTSLCFEKSLTDLPAMTVRNGP